MATYVPVTLHRRGVLRETTSREEELRLRWEGWSDSLDPDTPVPLPSAPGGEITLAEVLAGLAVVVSGADLAHVHTQGDPAGTWIIPIPPAFTRIPSVTIYVDGEEVETDVEVSGSLVTVTFGQPTAGVALLT